MEFLLCISTTSIVKGHSLFNVINAYICNLHGSLMEFLLRISTSGAIGDPSGCTFFKRLVFLFGSFCFANPLISLRVTRVTLSFKLHDYAFSAMVTLEGIFLKE